MTIQSICLSKGRPCLVADGREIDAVYMWPHEDRALNESDFELLRRDVDRETEAFDDPR